MNHAKHNETENLLANTGSMLAVNRCHNNVVITQVSMDDSSVRQQRTVRPNLPCC